MTALATLNPISQYFDFDGSPLDAGYLYFGAVGQNPVTAPQTVYWDAAATQPAAQPIRTLNGYPMRGGAPAIVYAVADYSLLVNDKRGRQLFYGANSADFGNSAAIAARFGDLASSADATKGAGMVGMDFALNYAVYTVGWGLRTAQGAVNVLRYIPPASWGPILAGDVGAADVTAYLQAALDAEDDLYVPNGRYNLSDALVCRRGLTLTGASRDGCAFVQNNAAKAVFIASNPQPSNANMDITLRNFIAVGGQTGLDIGVNGGNTPGVTLTCDRVWFYANGVNVRIRNGWQLYFYQCRMLAPTDIACVVFEFPTGGAFLNTVVLENNELQPVAAQYGVLLPAGNSNGIILRSNIIENSTHPDGVGIALSNPGADSCQGVTIEDNYFERLPGGCIRLSNNSANGGIVISKNKFYAPNTSGYKVISAIRGATIVANIFSTPGANPVPIESLTDCFIDGNMRMNGSGVVVGALVPDVALIKSAAGQHNAGLMIPVDLPQGNSLRTSNIWNAYQPPALFAIESGTSGNFKHVGVARPYGVDGSSIQHFSVQTLPFVLRISTNDNGATYILTTSPYGTTVSKSATGVVNINLPTGILDVFAEVQRHYQTSFSPSTAGTASLKHVVAIQASPGGSDELQVRFYNSGGSLADLATSESAMVFVHLIASD